MSAEGRLDLSSPSLTLVLILDNIQTRDYIATLRTMEETLGILDSYRNGRRREVWLTFVQFGSGQMTLHIYTEEGTIL